MTTVSIVLAVALFLFVRACMKWGFVVAVRVAAATLLGIPAFWVAGVIMHSTLGGLGFKAPAPWIWILGGGVIVLAARRIAGKFGWSNVLGWSLSAATGLCALVIMLFLFVVVMVKAGGAVNGTNAGVIQECRRRGSAPDGLHLACRFIASWPFAQPR